MATAVSTSVWGVDVYHSEINFKVKHMMVSTVTGTFKSFDAKVVSESEDFDGASVEFSADIDSIDTRNEQRDGHLKSDDFFNAEKFPKMTFQSTSFKKVGEGEYELVGNLTIRDITKGVKLSATYNGSAVDFYGNTKAGFDISGKISRKEFGLQWNAVTEAGSIVVGDQVTLDLNVQLQKQ
jgi:polyisoprenoid-binding protein YceI